ncbi:MULTISPECIES: O-methyltransferase [Acinetobacter]|uniref:O-methyltransferase n=1 Tax=Acinetobacter TaxID=469 RepID=UPI00103BE739|nr:MULTISPECIES: class I SAM-dependent methyltransferase [Acinetobacter]MDD2945378.1 class I SAM-dependent methyltransferase [Acinetobacter sp.]QQN38269.1 class I SAM-dependent methyltransferase [Acinetobacter sp. CS-2]TCH64728.1 methyltransferase domain-containing protein [Acinetobacter sp. ANC 4862]
MSMSEIFQKRMQELHQSFIKFDALQKDRIQRYRNIEPDSALFLAMQVRIQQSKNILEIGTSTGYSTLWLANAAQTSQGHVTTLEIDPARTQQAQQYANELQLSEVIDFWVGDAQSFLEKAEQQYDFILLDAERDAYMDYWQYLPHMLHPKNGVIFVDNVISHAAEVQQFIALVKSDERFMSMTLSIGSGLLMLCYK